VLWAGVYPRPRGCQTCIKGVFDTTHCATLHQYTAELDAIVRSMDKLGDDLGRITGCFHCSALIPEVVRSNYGIGGIGGRSSALNAHQ
jgi:hypothetical protein